MRLLELAGGVRGATWSALRLWARGALKATLLGVVAQQEVVSTPATVAGALEVWGDDIFLAVLGLHACPLRQ